ncbi:succinate dehydrogenase [Salinarchaeum sp. IM2453]|nr:succinate dehydrogenase [Salinarchaeum sp. IM2453]
MSQQQGQPSTFNANTVNWVLQRVTAVVLIVLLAGHWITLHYPTGSILGLEFPDRAAEITLAGTEARMEEWWYFGAMWLFLVTASFHGINGVYQALIGFGVEGAKRTIGKWVLIGSGVLIIVQGTRVALHMAGIL